MDLVETSILARDSPARSDTHAVISMDAVEVRWMTVLDARSLTPPLASVMFHHYQAARLHFQRCHPVSPPPPTDHVEINTPARDSQVHWVIHAVTSMEDVDRVRMTVPDAKNLTPHQGSVMWLHHQAAPQRSQSFHQA